MGGLRKLKKRTTKGLTTLSQEELNRQIYSQLPDLTEEQKKEICPKLNEWFKKIGYAMLLSNSNKDYTVFINRYQESEDAVNELMFECIPNRGSLKEFEYCEDDDSWNIWIELFDNKQLHFYKLFDFTWGIIHY